jgi:hypothetical protein
MQLLNRLTIGLLHADDASSPLNTLPDLFINNGTLVDLPCPDEVPDHAENNHAPSHHDRVVHRLRRDWSRRRPDRPEDDEDHVDTCICVVDDAKDSRDVEGTPDQWRGVECNGVSLRTGGARCGGGLVDDLLALISIAGLCDTSVAVDAMLGIKAGRVDRVHVGVDLALDAAVKQHRGRQEVRGIEARDGQADDVVEGNCAADVDEMEQSGKTGDDADGNNWDFVVFRDLAQGRREWRAVVASETPCHAAGGRGNADGTCPRQGKDDGAHDSGTGGGVDGIY